MENDRLIEVKNLRMYFPVGNGPFHRTHSFVRAVDDVSFSIPRGKTLGLVGESGCGKTTLGRCLIRALDATSGEILFAPDDGSAPVDLTRYTPRDMRPFRREMQMIFQDPYSSLDSRMTVFDIIAEPLKIGRVLSGDALRGRAEEFAEKVGLNVRHLNRYPHAFSGGQRQRIGIARALITQPRFIVADEPVSALDVSIQSQILNLLQDVQQEMRLTFLFISHDLRVIHYICDRVAVMYVGKMVELADTDELYDHPLHPYTRALLSAIPMPDPRQRGEHIPLAGDVANPVDPPAGCYFHPRCSRCADVCKTEVPALREVGPGHYCACHFAGEAGG